MGECKTCYFNKPSLSVPSRCRIQDRPCCGGLTKLLLEIQCSSWDTWKLKGSYIWERRNFYQLMSFYPSLCIVLSLLTILVVLIVPYWGNTRLKKSRYVVQEHAKHHLHYFSITCRPNTTIFNYQQCRLRDPQQIRTTDSSPRISTRALYPLALALVFLIPCRILLLCWRLPFLFSSSPLAPLRVCSSRFPMLYDDLPRDLYNDPPL